MMRRTRSIAIVVTGAAFLTGAIAFAAAHGPHDGGPFGHRGFAAHIDQALDAVNATPQQRQAIEAARDHVLDTMKQAHQGMRGDFQQMLTAFTADKLDPNEIAQIRAKHEAAGKQVGDAIVLALTDAHDALTSQQRQALVAWVKANRPAQPMKARHIDVMKHMAHTHIDDVLDSANVTAQQRQTIHDAVDRAIAQIQQNQQNHQAMMDQGLALFSADKLDQAKIAQFRAQQQAAHQQVADAIVAAVQTAHDTLQPAQRQAVVAFVKAHHGRHGG